jgi:hypothetical protein
MGVPSLKILGSLIALAKIINNDDIGTILTDYHRHLR